jgi:hypothetical protein
MIRFRCRDEPLCCLTANRRNYNIRSQVISPSRAFILLNFRIPPLRPDISLIVNIFQSKVSKLTFSE